MRRTFLGILSLMLCLMVQAQVTGRVIDSKTREVLDYVNVYYEGKTRANRQMRKVCSSLRKTAHGKS